jgi:hypothetical protein
MFSDLFMFVCEKWVILDISLYNIIHFYEPTDMEMCILTIHTATQHASSPGLYIILEELPSGEATVSCKKCHSNSKFFEKFSTDSGKPIMFPVKITFIYIAIISRSLSHTQTNRNHQSA